MQKFTLESLMAKKTANTQRKQRETLTLAVGDSTLEIQNPTDDEVFSIAQELTLALKDGDINNPDTLRDFNDRICEEIYARCPLLQQAADNMGEELAEPTDIFAAVFSPAERSRLADQFIGRTGIEALMGGNTKNG